MRLAEARTGLDDAIHSPVRLSLMCCLASVGSSDAQTLIRELALSYSLLSKHAAILEQVGYVTIAKFFSGGSPMTSYRLTRAGRRAFEQHLACLDRLVGGLTAQD